MELIIPLTINLSLLAEGFFLLTWKCPKWYEQGGGVGTVAVAPDNKNIAIGGPTDTVKLLDSAPVSILKEHKWGSFVSVVTYSPNGKYIEVGADDKKYFIK